MSYLTQGRSRRPAYKLALCWLALAVLCASAWALVIWGAFELGSWMAP